MDRYSSLYHPAFEIYKTNKTINGESHSWLEAEKRLREWEKARNKAGKKAKGKGKGKAALDDVNK